MNVEHSSQVAPGSGRAIPKSDGVPNQRRRASKIRGLEKLHKAASKVRDYQHCQVPGCSVSGIGRVHSAHLDGKGMGGDHGLRSSSRACFVTVCEDQHTGQRSLHSGHLKVVPQTTAGADGPMDWYHRETLDDDFFYFGTSRPLDAPGARIR